jgi:hypothetical protein
VNDDEISVATDAPCLAFRRWLRDLLRNHATNAPAASR